MNVGPTSPPKLTVLKKEDALTPEALDQLFADFSPELTELFLSGTEFDRKNETNHPYYLQFLEALNSETQLPNLHTLTIHHAELTPQQATEIIKNAKALNTLDLSWNRINFEENNEAFLAFC